MIKKLRRKFIMIIISILIVVFAVIIAGFNLMNYKSGEVQSRNFLNSLASHDGRIAKHNATSLHSTPPRPYKNSSISVRLDKDNKILNTLFSDNSEDKTDNIDNLVQSVLKKNQSYGEVSSYQYVVKRTSYGKLIILLDNSEEYDMRQRLLLISLMISGISLIILFIVSLFLSRLIVKPVEESFNRQKQFISDASHELKTPLSVISVNADVLENEIGSSKWLNYIKSETNRMNGLVNHLLNIARLDDTKRPMNITSFPLSEAIYQILLPFESSAFEQHKSYTYEIADSAIYTGEQESIKQMAAILIDNAMKHTDENGSIHVSLKYQSSRICFEVFNTGEGIDPSEKDKIFERFYCSDYSRSREYGGYGLGLSIAKSIVEAHHGKISVQSKKGEWAKFTVVL